MSQLENCNYVAIETEASGVGRVDSGVLSDLSMRGQQTNNSMDFYHGQTWRTGGREEGIHSSTRRWVPPLLLSLPGPQNLYLFKVQQAGCCKAWLTASLLDKFNSIPTGNLRRWFVIFREESFVSKRIAESPTRVSRHLPRYALHSSSWYAPEFMES